MLDPRKLLYMKSVVEHGSFRKAARELQVSQPALSISMDRLEAAVGVKLLERSPTGVVPTPAGEMLYSHAWFIQDEIDVARQQIQGHDWADRHHITLGAIVSVVANVIPLALCKWRESYPHTPLRIVENSHPMLLLGLLRTDLDFIIAWTGGFDLTEGIKQRVLFRDRLMVVARPGHPVHDKSVSWCELRKYPWVTHLVWHQLSPVAQVMESQDLPLPEQLTECNSVSFMKTVIENSDHIGMLPNHVVDNEVAQGRLVPLSVTSPIQDRNIAVFFRERSLLDGASRKFLDHVAETGTRLGRSMPTPFFVTGDQPN